MDMLVKLYALPDSRPAYDRLLGAGIVMRRALAPEKHKVTAWVRQTFSEAWASEAEVAFSRQPASCFIAVQQKKIVGQVFFIEFVILSVGISGRRAAF